MVTKKGIAAEMEVLLAQDLLELLGNEYKIVHANPSESAIKHLKNLNIEANTPYNISDYLVKIKSALKLVS